MDMNPRDLVGDNLLGRALQMMQDIPHALPAIDAAFIERFCKPVSITSITADDAGFSLAVLGP